MADKKDEQSVDNPMEESVEEVAARVQKAEAKIFENIDTDPMTRVVALESINAFRGWFSLHIINPFIDPINPPLIHMPDSLEDAAHEAEFVYPIIDTGDMLAASKAEDMFTAGFSMCKLYYTIEKIIWLLVERLKSGGIIGDEGSSEGQEVQIAIHGYQSALRYAFASIINLPANVVIVNFDPGSWGEDYLAVVSKLAEKGYGYPDESPRDVFRKHPGPAKKQPG